MTAGDAVVDVHKCHDGAADGDGGPAHGQHERRELRPREEGSVFQLEVRGSRQDVGEGDRCQHALLREGKRTEAVGWCRAMGLRQGWFAYLRLTATECAMISCDEQPPWCPLSQGFRKPWNTIYVYLLMFHASFFQRGFQMLFNNVISNRFA
ncbi:unnamed protein product [Ixodes pacificus]